MIKNEMLPKYFELPPIISEDGESMFTNSGLLGVNIPSTVTFMGRIL